LLKKERILMVVKSLWSSHGTVHGTVPLLTDNEPAPPDPNREDSLREVCGLHFLSFVYVRREF